MDEGPKKRDKETTNTSCFHLLYFISWNHSGQHSHATCFEQHVLQYGQKSYWLRQKLGCSGRSTSSEISNSNLILSMEEILHHLGCMKPCKINWCRISSINSIATPHKPLPRLRLKKCGIFFEHQLERRWIFVSLPCDKLFTIPSWWLNHPSEKYARQLGTFPQVSVWTLNKMTPTPEHSILTNPKKIYGINDLLFVAVYGLFLI